jgi:lysophospholipase L1-like esterase
LRISKISILISFSSPNFQIPVAVSPRRSSPVKKVFLGLAALPLIIEGGLWAFARAPENPKFNVFIESKVPGLKPEVSLTIDRMLGARTHNWTEEGKPGGAIRILCVGGESTWAQLQNTEETWWAKLQQELSAKYPQARIEIMANGASSMESVSGAKWVESVTPRVRPDIIIANIGAGDVYAAPLEYKYDSGKLASLSGQRTEVGGFRGLILKCSQLARWRRASNIEREGAIATASLAESGSYQTILEKRRKELQKIQPISGPFRLSDNDPRTEYIDGLKALAEVAKAFNAQLIVTGEPILPHRDMPSEAEELLTGLLLKASGANTAHRVDPGWFGGELRRFQEAAREWADTSKIPFFDMNGSVPRDGEHFVTDKILTDKGSAFMAQKIAELAASHFEKVLKK